MKLGKIEFLGGGKKVYKNGVMNDQAFYDSRLVRVYAMLHKVVCRLNCQRKIAPSHHQDLYHPVRKYKNHLVFMLTS